VNTRHAHPADLSALRALEEEVFDPGYPPVVLRQLLDLFPDLFFAAELDGDVVGYVSGGLSSDRDRAWLLSLAVAPRAKGRGIGRALVETLIEALSATPARDLRLTMDPTNASAAGLYARFGFREAGREEAYFGPGFPRAVLVRQL
jgi:ribosomal-protein-alanine N-acetyltransferase